MGFCEVLTIVFVVLKLVGTIDWSWFWVLSPMLVAALMYLALVAVWVVIAINNTRGFKR